MISYLHVVIDHEDVGHRAAVDILQVVVAALCQDQAVALLLNFGIFKWEYGTDRCLASHGCRPFARIRR